MPPLHTLKGVGPKTEALFARLGIIDTDSLIHYYPRTYDIYEAPAEIRSLEESTVAAITLQRVSILTRYVISRW